MKVAKMRRGKSTNEKFYRSEASTFHRYVKGGGISGVGIREAWKRSPGKPSIPQIITA